MKLLAVIAATAIALLVGCSAGTPLTPNQKACASIRPTLATLSDQYVAIDKGSPASAGIEAEARTLSDASRQPGVIDPLKSDLLNFSIQAEILTVAPAGTTPDSSKLQALVTDCNYH